MTQIPVPDEATYVAVFHLIGLGEDERTAVEAYNELCATHNFENGQDSFLYRVEHNPQLIPVAFPADL